MGKKSLPIKKRKIRKSDESGALRQEMNYSHHIHQNFVQSYVSSFGNHQVIAPSELQYPVAYENQLHVNSIGSMQALANSLNVIEMPERKPDTIISNHVLASNETSTSHSRRPKRPSSSKPDSVHREMWQKRYNELQDFRRKTGHCNVPQRFDSNKPLGKWVHKQRQELKKMRDGDSSSLSAERVEALDLIGFQCTTSNRAEALWQQRFNELEGFKAESGHCNVPQKFAPNIALGKWVHRQRHEFKKIRDGDASFLTKHRIDKLIEIGLCPNRQEAVWQQRYRELVEFKRKNGHCNVPRKYPPNKPLGLWVNKQRHELKKTRDGEGSCLSAHRVEALEKVGLHYMTYYRKEAKKAASATVKKSKDRKVDAWMSRKELTSELKETPRISPERFELLKLASECIAKSA